MSPEQQPATPEASNETPYLTRVEEVISEAAASDRQTDSRFQAVDTFIDEVIQAARSGEISGSRGTYTEAQMLDQLLAFREAAYSKTVESAGENQQAVDAFMLIPKAGGLRTAFRSMWANEATHRVLEESLKLHDPEFQETLKPTADPEKVGEATLAAVGIEQPMIDKVPDSIINPEQPVETELAPEAASEVRKISKQEYLDKLTDGFSENDIQNLKAYAKAKAAQNRAEAAKEFDNKAHYKRETYDYFKALPKDVQKIANQYAHAYNYY